MIHGRVSEKFVDPSGLVIHPSPLSLAGATVEFLDYDLTTSTDENGCFAFDVPLPDAPYRFITVRASAPGFGSLTQQNVEWHRAGGGISFAFQLERGGPDRVVDYCHFQAWPGSAAGQIQYEHCAEQGKLITSFEAPSPGALPGTGAAGRPTPSGGAVAFWAALAVGFLGLAAWVLLRARRSP